LEGSAAALQAARCGARTALLEKTIVLGGLATGGLVNIYLPLCDGRGTQVLFGMAEEFLHLAIHYGPWKAQAACHPIQPRGLRSRTRRGARGGGG